MRNELLISQNQLNHTKVYRDRWHWITTLPSGISFVEVGVAAGDFSQHVLKNLNPSELLLVDTFMQDDPALARPGQPQRYFRDEHYNFVLQRFSEYKNVKLIKGDSRLVLEEISINNPKSYDVVYIDADHSYDVVKEDIRNSAKIIKDDGILAINDYIGWDEKSKEYGVIKAVNEFLNDNKNWYVAGISLERNMYSDIYLKKS